MAAPTNAALLQKVLANPEPSTQSGGRCSKKSRVRQPCRKNCVSTARTSKPTAPRQAEKGEEVQAIGRSRGGRTSKIHALADHRGRPIAFALTPGNVADITVAQAVVAAVEAPKRLIADKAYDAEHFRNWLAQRRIKAVIPSTASRRTPYPIDRNAYRRRNVIERLFCKLKNWRRITTRYVRLARNYIAAIALAAVLVAWIN